MTITPGEGRKLISVLADGYCEDKNFLMVKLLGIAKFFMTLSRADLR